MPRQEIRLTEDKKIRIGTSSQATKEKIAILLMDAGYEDAANYVMEMIL